MTKRIKTIEDVAGWRLCCGCGACAGLSPDAIQMVDIVQSGLRPRFVRKPTAEVIEKSLAVCPGIALNRVPMPNDQLGGKDVYEDWGPILKIWEGFAVDPEIRYCAASGGVASALGLFALDKWNAEGVVQIRPSEKDPFVNKTCISKNRKDLIAAAGSRYAPASPADILRNLKSLPGQYVFVGKPCDVAAVRKAILLEPDLADKVIFTIAFFCAGVPSTLGTYRLAQAAGVRSLEKVKSIRYRGRGWPGEAVVEYLDENGYQRCQSFTYDQSWKEILQKYRQWRCYICPDHIGEFADIAVGDAWHRPLENHQPGLSVVIARTSKGFDIIKQAAKADYLHLSEASPEVLPNGMPWQIPLKNQMWGRLVTLRLCGIPTPRFISFQLAYRWWYGLSIFKKAKTIFGTLKRIFVKQLYRPEKVTIP